MIATNKLMHPFLGLYQHTFLICSVIPPWRKVTLFAYKRPSAIDQRPPHSCMAIPVISVEREEDVGLQHMSKQISCHQRSFWRWRESTKIMSKDLNCASLTFTSSICIALLILSLTRILTSLWKLYKTMSPPTNRRWFVETWTLITWKNHLTGCQSCSGTWVFSKL